MRYGLNSKHVNAINRVFKGYPEVEKAILYGSRAMPKASPWERQLPQRLRYRFNAYRQKPDREQAV